MADEVFPQSGDVGTETQFRNVLRMASPSYVESGYGVSSTSGLTVTIASGDAFVEGSRVKLGSTSDVTVSDDTTTYIWLDDEGNFQQTSTRSAPSGSIFIMEVVASGGSITSTDTDGQVTFGHIGMARKTSDESVSSQGTLQDDANLWLGVRENTLYRLVLDVGLDEPASGGFQSAFSLPSGSGFATIVRSGAGTNDSALAHDITTAFSSTIGNVEHLLRYSGYVSIGATGGIMQFQWAQAASDAATLTVKKGSILTLQEV